MTTLFKLFLPLLCFIFFKTASCRCNLHTIKYIQVYNSMTFSKFTELYNLHCIYFYYFFWWLNKRVYYFIFFFKFFYCCTRGTLWHLQMFLQYIIAEFTPPSFSFIPHLPHSWNSFNRSHFSIFIYEYIFPPYSPSYALSLHLVFFFFFEQGFPL
jgi:hypothetical protein